MSVFTIQVPDGRKIKISAPDQATAVRGAKEYVASHPANVAPPNGNPDVAALQQAHQTMPRPQPPTPQQQVDSAVEAYRMANHPEMTVAQYNDRLKGSGVADPLNPIQIAQNDQLFGFGDELSGLASGTAAAFSGQDFGKNYDAGQRMQEARRSLGLQKGGVPAAAASVVGNLTSLGVGAPAAAAAPATWFGKAAQFGKDTLSGATTGAVMGGVQGFGEANGDLENRLQGAQQGAGVGAAFGAAAPTVIGAVTAPFRSAAQRGAVNAAIKNAPSAADLSDAATQMFAAAKSSGVAVKAEKFSQVVADLIQKAKGKDIDPDLDGAALTVYRRAAELAQQGASDPRALSLGRLHNLRQKAQDVVMDPASKNRTKQFAQDVVDGIDNMISTLKPGDLTGVPNNRIGHGPHPGTAAGNALLDGISTWAKAKKVGLLESAMRAAENYAPGLESGLRAQFKSLLNGVKTRNLWTPIERKAMQEVIGGNLTVRALRALGIFKGFASAGVGGGLGSVFGPMGAAAGTALGGAAGVAARAVTEAAAAKSANRAARIVATPGVPQVPLALPRIRGTTLPLLEGQWRQP